MEVDYDVQVGELAPDFTLPDQNGDSVTLSSLRGEPVVLIFYLFDWSWICTEEFCALRDAAPLWEETGARVVGISRDSYHSHKAWKQHLGLPYTLLEDLRGHVARQYGAWNQAEHRADRMTVVIDAEGIVRYAVHKDSGTKRDHREALEVVRSLIARRPTAVTR